MKHISSDMRVFLSPFSALLSALLSASVSTWADAWDPADNESATATALTISDSVSSHGTHTLSNLVDDAEDWFSIYLDAGKRYRVESTGSSDIRADLYADDTGMTPVINGDDFDDTGEGFNFQILYVPAVSGTYYLKVTDAIASSESAASYELHYVEETFLDPWDPDDDAYSGATALATGSAVGIHGPHNLSDSDHYDWFHFNLTAGIEYTFRAVNGGWDTVGALYQEGDSALVASGDDEGEDDNRLNFIITYTPSLSGNYYLKIRGYDVGSELNYSLEYLSDAGPVDGDGDGMEDDWEIYYFGSTNALPDDHGDTDMQANLDEYIAGTDPTDPASFFSITDWSAGSFIMEWLSVTGREYRVLWTDNLTNGFEYITPAMDHPQNSYTDTLHSAGSRGYYKVEVQRK